MNPGRKLGRRGFSLVEMLAVMATLSLVLGLCVALLEMLLRLNASGREHIENEAAIARMSRVFREDVRDAGEIARCPLGGQSTALSLVVPGGDLVEYQVIKDALVRKEWRRDEILAQERFRLPASSYGRFERHGENEQAVVSLVIDRRSKQGPVDANAHTFRIEATPGATRRFDEQGGEKR